MYLLSSSPHVPLPQIGGVHHRALKNLSDGTFSLEELQTIVRGNDLHWSALTLVCVENTHNMLGGKALPIQWMDDVRRDSWFATL